MIEFHYRTIETHLLLVALVDCPEQFSCDFFFAEDYEETFVRELDDHIAWRELCTTGILAR